ncbi:uncharacterized protein LOC111693563 [Trichogramma pretiosum]|uniref:uncharacterized protein LOC111693563 n=1 Tax=Trichogramma pretiosum TaxID=7493 RepID=UPI000C71B3C9|nr:uncharacterized protein LOC111693563 [Trichogramma pretiosum]
MMEKFLDICDDFQATIQVDAQNESGFTPLQNAVESLKPNVVDVLLDRGADLSRFVFPIENICENFEKNARGWDKLRSASGALSVVERLEKRGYDLNRDNALTILDSFKEYGLFEKSSDLEKCWRDDDEFASRAKEIIVTSSLSLHDLIQLRPKEEEKLLTYTNYFEIERSNNLDEIPKKYLDICLTHLCEKMSRGYVRRLAQDPFQELTRHKLPILCCEKIIDELKNEDLFEICKAGEILAEENRAKMCN